MATAWVTAAYVASAPTATGRKFYLIQHYEVWDGPSAEVDATWRLPLHKIVIARWLADLAQRLDPRGLYSYIPNAIDFDTFQPASHPSTPATPPISIGMLWHPQPDKASRDGIEALSKLHENYPDVRAHVFGHPSRPTDLPLWIDYSEALSGADLVEYYQSLDIFLHTSVEEGWGLPAAEAMACGVALVAADNKGVQEFANSSNAIFYRRGDWMDLLSTIERLLKDTNTIDHLKAHGPDSIVYFNWDRATDQLEHVLADGGL